MWFRTCVVRLPRIPQQLRSDTFETVLMGGRGHDLVPVSPILVGEVIEALE